MMCRHNVFVRGVIVGYANAQVPKIHQYCNFIEKIVNFFSYRQICHIYDIVIKIKHKNV